MPTTAANYVAASRVLSPFAGFALNWALLVATFFGLPVLAWGFGAYLAELVQGITPAVGAVAILLVLGLVNYLGIRVSAWVQTLMVAVLLAALLVFILGGLPHVDPNLQSPLFPLGFGAVLLTAIPAYFSYIGFTSITEVAGEIQNPRRNIPRTLVVTFAAVLLLYVSTMYVFTGVVDWKLAASATELSEAAARFLPPYLVTFIRIGALLAAATTIHAVLLTTCRDIMMLGRDGVFPTLFGRIHPRFGTPHVALGFAVLIAMVGVSMALTLEEYALLTVMGLMVVQTIASVAVFRLPHRYPGWWERSPIKFSRFWRWFTLIGTVVFSLLFLVFGMVRGPRGALLFVGLMLSCVPYWYLRKRFLASHGVDLERQVAAVSGLVAEEIEET